MTNHRFAKLFDGAARKAEDKITEREINLAASIQAVTEEIVSAWQLLLVKKPAKRTYAYRGCCFKLRRQW